MSACAARSHRVLGPLVEVVRPERHTPTSRHLAYTWHPTRGTHLPPDTWHTPGTRHVARPSRHSAARARGCAAACSRAPRHEDLVVPIRIPAGLFTRASSTKRWEEQEWASESLPSSKYDALRRQNAVRRHTRTLTHTHSHTHTHTRTHADPRRRTHTHTLAHTHTHARAPCRGHTRCAHLPARDRVVATRVVRQVPATPKRRAHVRACVRVRVCVRVCVCLCVCMCVFSVSWRASGGVVPAKASCAPTRKGRAGYNGYPATLTGTAVLGGTGGTGVLGGTGSAGGYPSSLG